MDREMKILSLQLKIPMNNYFLKGERCILQPLDLESMPAIANQIAQWINDEVVTYFMFTGQKPLTREQVIVNIKKDLDAGNIVFLVCDSKSKKLIGYAGLYDINPVARKAEFRILIGEKTFWGKGYGTEITELLTYYGFDRLNLHRIYLGYTVANKAAQRTYEKAGYKHEGIQKDDIYRNSIYYDTARMAILRKDYYEKYYKAHVKKFKPSIS